MKKEKANVIKANYRLQQKVGAGTVDTATIQDMQNVIEDNTVDFVPVGMDILRKLEAALMQASNPSVTMQKLKADLTAPVMELKANAATFHYPLVGRLANIMLSFLEAIRIMDKDAIDIVQAHHDTLRMIILRGMKGDGGVAGDNLARELELACQRYYNKKFAN